MTSPTVQARNTGTNGAGTSHTINLPSSIQAGDLLIVWWGFGNDPGATTTTGWTNMGVDGTNGRGAIVYKTATGSEGATDTWSTTNSVKTATIAWRISGWQGTPEKGTAAQANSTNADPPSITPSWGAADILVLVMMDATLNTNVASAAPTNYGNLTTAATTSGSASAVSSAERSMTATSTEDPGTFTSPSGNWVAQTVAIQGVSGLSVFPVSFPH